MSTALLEPVIHITAVSKDDPEFREKYDPNKNNILTIPDGTTEIGDAAFYNCAELIEVHFPDTLTTIRRYAFEHCTGLTKLHLPESLTTIERYAFYGCTGLTELHLPESLTTIGYKPFSDCIGLTELRLPKTLTTIGEAAFDGCTGLTQVHFPETLTTIGEYAFYECSGLTQLHLPESLTTIEMGAFYGTRLTDIYCLSTQLGMLIDVREDDVNIHCPAVARFMTGDSFEMELIVRSLLEPEFRDDLKAQVRSALEERNLLEGDQDFDLPDYFTEEGITTGEVDFKNELIVIWL